MNSFNISINYHSIVLIIGSIFILYMSLDSVLKHPRYYYARHFSWLCLSLAFFLLGLNISPYIVHVETQNLVIKCYQLAFPFVPTLLFQFTVTFLKNYHLIKMKFALLAFGISLLFSLGILLDYSFIVIAIQKSRFGPFAQYSWFGVAFLLYLGISMISVLALFFKALNKEKDVIIKKHIRLMAVGVVIAIFGMTIVLSNFSMSFIIIGQLCLIVFMFLFFYAIYIYHTSRLQEIVLNIISNAVTILLAYFLWTFLMSSWVMDGQHLTWSTILLNGIALIPSLLILYLLPKYISNLLQHYKFSIDSTYFDKVVKLKYPGKCAEQIGELIQNIAGTQSVRTILFDQYNINYELIDYDLTITTIDAPLQAKLMHLVKFPKLLTWDDLLRSSQPLEHKQELIDIFTHFNCQLLLPLTHNDRLYCLFLVGRLDKLKLFKPLELQLLDQLILYSAVAMTNAFYYDLVRQLSIDLWGANTRLNDKINNSSTALESAVEKNQLLYEEHSNFFTMALHNIRTPLTSITAAATILWRSHQSKEKESVYRILNNNIQRLNALALDVVEIAKLDNANRTFKYLKFDINDLIHELFTQLSRKYSDKNIQWHYVQTENIKYIHAEIDQIKLVLQNLFSNAFKFSNNNTKIVVTLKFATKKDFVKYGLGNVENPGEFYEFAIADTGSGIPYDEQDHIFDSFVQGLQSKTYSDSTGLGLYIVKRIVETHGGAVAFRSEPNQGSTFYFIIPV